MGLSLHHEIVEGLGGVEDRAKVGIGADWLLADGKGVRLCRVVRGAAHLSLPRQVSSFQMAVHVEGNGGWADRLRHLLLSGFCVLKQASGVSEWWEPALRPWVRASRSRCGAGLILMCICVVWSGWLDAHAHMW